MPSLTQLLTGVGGLLGGAFARDLIAWARGARKDNAEADKILSDTVDEHLQKLLEGYERRVTDLTAEVHALRDQLNNAMQRIDAARVEARTQSCALRGACKEFAPVET